MDFKSLLVFIYFKKFWLYSKLYVFKFNNCDLWLFFTYLVQMMNG